MKILIFINIGDIPMTEEEMLAKISKCSSFHGGILNQSQDNRSVWIVRTELSSVFITIEQPKLIRNIRV